MMMSPLFKVNRGAMASSCWKMVFNLGWNLSDTSLESVGLLVE